jgi:hypothetical protein
MSLLFRERKVVNRLSGPDGTGKKGATNRIF